MFQFIRFFSDFCRELEYKEKRQVQSTNDVRFLASQITRPFFSAAAAALKALESKITLEFICGGLPEELTKMRLGASTRPKHFPTQHMRMWMSNVP